MNLKKQYIYFFIFALVFSFSCALVFSNWLVPLVWFCAGIIVTVAALSVFLIRMRREIIRMDTTIQSLHDLIAETQWERWQEVQDRLGVGDDEPEKRLAVH